LLNQTKEIKMARKTKQELNAERLAYEAQKEQVAREAYPARLMAVLELATEKYNFELTVYQNKFYVVDRDDRDDNYLVPYKFEDYESLYSLESLEDSVNRKAKARAEELRRYEVRKAALAKLTAEERELLDL
jgi:hypothetical protein